MLKDREKGLSQILISMTDSQIEFGLNVAARARQFTEIKEFVV